MKRIFVRGWASVWVRFIAVWFFGIAFACGSDPGLSDLDSYSADEIRNGAEITGRPYVGIVFDTNRRFVCTGTLIRSNVVLTAAHCVDGAVATDLVFSNQPGPGPLPFSDSIAALNTLKHPTYQTVNPPIAIQIDGVSTGLFSGAVGADLALIRLSKRVTGLNLPKLDRDGLTVGSKITAVGYGRDETDAGSGTKRQGVMRFVGTADIRRSPTGSYIADSLLFSIATAADQITCPGDSGGPVLESVDGQLFVAGVASASLSTNPLKVCTSTELAIHVSVPVFADWIASKSLQLAD